MRTFSALVLLVLAFVRCSAPDTCVRNSDCNDGDMCVSGGCFSADAPTSPSSIVGDGADDAASAAGNEAGTIAASDAGSVGTKDAASDAGSDGGNDADIADASTTD